MMGPRVTCQLYMWGHDDYKDIIRSDFVTPTGDDHVAQSDNWTGNDDYMSVWLNSNTGKALRLYSYGTSGNNNRRPVYFKSTSNPVHAVISYDSSTNEVNVYFRGGAIGDNEESHTFTSDQGANFDWTNIISGTTNIHIGGFNNTTRWYTYSVYKNRILSSSERETLYNLGYEDPGLTTSNKTITINPNTYTLV